MCGLVYIGDHINLKEYWKRVWNVQKDYMTEKGKNDLEDFYQLISYAREDFSQKANETIGRRIFDDVKGNAKIRVHGKYYAYL